MFAVAHYSPASSPEIRPPSQPVFDITPPPPLLEPAAPPPFHSLPSPPSVSPAPSAPSVTSPATTSLPFLSPTLPQTTNPAPPVNSPAIQLPPVFPSPSPEIPLVPFSSPPVTSNESPTLPTTSPLTLIPPAVTFPSPATPASPPPPPPLPYAKKPLTTTFPPSAVAPAPVTATFPPPSSPAWPETTSPPPSAAFFPFTELPMSSRAAPSSPAMPESAPPEVKVPSSPPSGSLPVAVDVEKHSEFKMSSGLIVGIVIGGIVFVLVLAFISVLCRNSNKKKQKNLRTHQREESSPCVGGVPKGSHVIRVMSNPPRLIEGCEAFGPVNSRDVTAIANIAASSIAFGSVNGIFTYDELVVATNGFSEANLLGEGGFGYVYKGVLPCGKEIAVKQLKTGSQQGEREFRAEVETISMVHHKHLVELVGYCISMVERLLVYEFSPNSTLEYHLHGEGMPVVEWEKRIKIALGTARGLAYLHEDCNPAIIHRDIKASNILLDFNFEAKVSDFGLAKIFPNTDGCITHLTTRVVGTFGYLAPEYASSGKLTDKSDVYSYGVVLLELLTGRPPITSVGSRNESLVDWARPLLAQALQDGDFSNLVDPRLQKNYGADEMARMITCAAACVRHSARLRPRMSQIVGALEGLVSVSDLVGDITPGHTTLYSWSNSSNYDACHYRQDLWNFILALSSQKYSSSGQSESTSAYGLHPSASSSEVQQTS